MRRLFFTFALSALPFLAAGAAHGQSRVAGHDSSATGLLEINSEIVDLMSLTEKQRQKLEQRLEQLEELRRRARNLTPVITQTRCCRADGVSQEE